MDFMDGRLVGALDQHLVNIHVGWATGAPNQRVRHVLAGEWLDTFVYLFRPPRIAFEADQRELGLRHARIDRTDAHSGAAEFQPQRACDLQLSRFGGTVSRATFVRHPASYR